MIFPSLRSRLIAIIFTPLFLIATAITFWQYSTETERAEELFDRGLLSAALAISRDVAISDGDALSPATRRLVNNTSGGEVFYHVFAPDGVFVTGYSTPPVLPKTAPSELSDPYYYDARYQGRDARVLRFQYVTTVSDVSGVFNVTVWQNADLRQAFVQEIVTRSISLIALIVLSVGFVVWFGVGFGLRPLLDLENAIAKRSATELEPIRRKVPVEARGLVTTLNQLLDRVSRRISSKDEFISNAAHQLRNPVAGVLALAEAVQTAPDQKAARQRSAELVKAARQTSRLTNQLLSFERAAGSDLAETAEHFDLKTLVEEVTGGEMSRLAEADIQLSTCLCDEKASVLGDRIMVKEAILNVVNNAQVHGGPKMNKIHVSLEVNKSDAILKLRDNGVGIPPDKRMQAVSRFGQASAGKGSGLGLAIAIKVLSRQKGQLTILDCGEGTAIQMIFPLSQPAKTETA